MSTLKELIRQRSLDYAKDVLGEEDFKNDPEAVEAIAGDFENGILEVLEEPERFGLVPAWVNN